MTTIKIEIDATQLGSNVAGEWLSIDPAEWPNNALAEIFRYGMQRKFNDGNGGKDVADADKVASAMQRADNFSKGIVRVTSAGVSTLQKAMRSVARLAIRASKSPDEYRAFNKLERAEQDDQLDAIIAANRETMEAKGAAKMRLDAERKAAIDDLTGGLDIDI